MPSTLFSSQTTQHADSKQPIDRRRRCLTGKSESSEIDMKSSLEQKKTVLKVSKVVGRTAMLQCVHE